MDDLTTVAKAVDGDAFARMHGLAEQQPNWCCGKTRVARCYQAAKLTRYVLGGESEIARIFQRRLHLWRTRVFLYDLPRFMRHKRSE
jgi:hypothetical protein